jgi:hypothetical protein
MNWFNGVLVASLQTAVPFASAVEVMAADDRPLPKSHGPADASSKSASKPMIIHNSDGTFTIQKEPPDGTSKGKNGLVITPQVVVPLVTTTKKRHDATSVS